jgi:hypothetical protein
MARGVTAVKTRMLSGIIALCGLWEFGDVAAVFVPGFGRIPASVWNHIVVGLGLMIVGVWAALTHRAGTARTLNGIAAAAGAWLIVSSIVLRWPEAGAGLWNDVVVGAVVLGLGGWGARKT